jgi:hypothetical protein
MAPPSREISGTMTCYQNGMICRTACFVRQVLTAAMVDMILFNHPIVRRGVEGSLTLQDWSLFCRAYVALLVASIVVSTCGWFGAMIFVGLFCVAW